jgi:hypothetical protein
MNEEATPRTAKALALGVGINFYVVRSRYGRFLAVQVPSDDCEILATVIPPKSANDRQASRVIGRQTVLLVEKGSDRRASGVLVRKTR